jgi:hypothetical protein
MLFYFFNTGDFLFNDINYKAIKTKTSKDIILSGILIYAQSLDK